ncbi:TusE/DsrC/DsvC family sulfurtransferase [candidate division LCP-89 bacterium B3_LCP]|uniref:TusE/DsrC/DsvC family sulfurtransferase n=1 Tax=candidate division LCP-89 bacterium B3_LCP TaxID=2012998 RepID=A0A532UU17_UNCL8|nr:MAG: TusE/DsrC/DsvC family sulfurtransferase [candidate division LCP-89 bacterium B3_LCP]
MSNIEPETVTFAGKIYSLDQRGFLKSPEQWDEDFAEGMAEVQEIYGGLTEKHWDLIHYIRRKFTEEETIPVVVLACADNNLKLSDLRFLFPTGYHRGACRIAGINYDFMYKTNFWLTYETTTLQKEEYKLTHRGFLEDFSKWDERFAQIIIREWKLPGGLTDRHREIISYLRDFYERMKNIPTFFEMCKANNLDVDEFKELFPEGYRRGACRIAGLPFFG